MAEIAAVGLASSIVTFLDVSAKVLQRLRDYHATTHDAPTVLRDTTAQLALVAGVLRQCEGQFSGSGSAGRGPASADESAVSLSLPDASSLASTRDGSLSADDDIGNDADSARLAAVVDGCRAHVERLQTLIDRMLPAGGESRVDRTRKALTSLWLERDVEDVQRQLARSVQLLGLYFIQRAAVAANAATDAAFTNSRLRGTRKTLDLSHDDDQDGLPYGGIFDMPSALRVAHMVRRPMLLRLLADAFGEGAGSCSSYSQQLTVVVLLGLGGQGETQLALEYCRLARASGRYSFIAWLDATSSDSVSRGLEALAARIAPCRTFTDTEVTVAFVIGWFSRRMTPWLIVFDNYDQPSTFQHNTSFFPPASTGSILVTSRHAGSERLGHTRYVGYLLYVPGPPPQRESDNSFCHQ
jgi:hypothetical protein